MKFGIDRTDLTPSWNTYLAGYGIRRDLSDGVNDPLTFTSLVIEERGRTIFLGAADLVGLGREHSVRLRRKIADLLGIGYSDVMINCSHTHGGILVSDSSSYQLDGINRLDHARKNRRFIERRILASVRRAAESMRAGKLYYGEGETTLMMNRRPVVDGAVQNRPNPPGKVDGCLKVLRINDEEGRIAAVLARVSCHPVATGPQHLVTADFPGSFRVELERCFPGAKAVFLQGVGADARPALVAAGDRWRFARHDELPLIGLPLAREVIAVLAGGKMTEIDRLRLRSEVRVVELPVINRRVQRRDLEEMLKLEYPPDEKWKPKAIERVLARKKFNLGMPITMQMISFGPRLSILGVEAEVLCALGEKIEQPLSTEFRMTLGYTNGARCYLPDRVEYARGGYEVDAWLLDDLPSPLSPDLEDIMVGVAADFDRKLNR